MEIAMHKIISFLNIFLIVLWIVPNESQMDDQKRTFAKVSGEITIGAIFPIHHLPSSTNAFTRKCGKIWEQYGIHRIEIFLQTLDKINADTEILSGITLGCDIRDSCWFPPVALEQSIDFIKNSIASQEKMMKNRTGVEDPCDSENEDPIAGLIGPGSSSVTIQIQNLLSLFHIPQIGYSATSKDLSNKSLYNYFLRVVPSDKLQAKALLDIVLHYNWTYISTVYTEGNYGASGMEEFQEMMRHEGLCEATAEKVVNENDTRAHDDVIEALLKTEGARVVVCFCEGLTIRRLLEAADRKGRTGHFLFLGSDGWNVRPDVVKDIDALAAGGMSMKLYSPPMEEFNSHYLNLKPDNNSRNPWFKEFWEEKFQCNLPDYDSETTYDKICTGEEDLSEIYIPDAKLGFVVNAIYTMAHALDSMQKDICGAASGLCKEMMPINGTLFREYLFNVSFESYSNDSINFNKNGDPPARYDIMNYRPTSVGINGSLIYDYVRIGGWDNGILSLQEDVFWPGDEFGEVAEEYIIESVCSKPCPFGEIKKINDGGLPCCWVCTQCKEDEFLLDEHTCEPCALGWLPDDNMTGCYMIPIEFMQWGDSEAIVAMVFSCVGVIATGWTAFVFMRHNDTPVVKASTRELSYIILVGICICYLASFPLVAKPSLVTCYLARILPGFSFSLIYGALVTKTNRIARILAGSKKKIMTRKPRFMSASAQLVITFIIIGIEVAIIVVMLIFEPADFKLIYPTKTRVRLTCNVTTKGIIVPLGFVGFLIAMCTLYAVKTRNLPENFNEAKFIGFTMYTTCIIWLAFVGIYFGSDNKVITMCMAITLSATVALILLFFPKIYIIICKPEKNNRSAFTTSKDVRCHIGSTTRYSSPSPSVYQWKVNHTPTEPKLLVCHKEMWNDKAFENAAMTIYRQKSVFDRWRRRKNDPVQAARENPGSPAYSQVATSATATPPGRGTDMDLVDEHITPSKGKIIRRVKAPAPFKDFEMEFDEMEAMIEEEEERESLLSETSHVHTVDSSVQTSNELLHDMLMGLRKRKAKSADLADYEKQSSNSRSTSTSTPSGSTPSDKCLAIRNNYYRGNEKVQSSHGSGECNQVGIHKYAMSPQHSDNSPLLSSSREFCQYESTSEETLSELAEPMHDLDTLLQDIEPHQGSLGSLAGLTNSAGNLASDNTQESNETVISRKPSVDPYQKQSRHAAPHHKDNKLSRFLDKCTKPRSPKHIRTKSANSRIIPPKPSIAARKSFSDSGYKTNSPTKHMKTSSNIVIPLIKVEKATPSSSEISVDSGRPSEQVFENDSRHASYRSARTDRTSAEVSSIEDLSICMTDMSNTESPVFESDAKHTSEADSVTEFKDYLRTKGLKLDLNTVQSSEV